MSTFSQAIDLTTEDSVVVNKDAVVANKDAVMATEDDGTATEIDEGSETDEQDTIDLAGLFDEEPVEVPPVVSSVPMWQYQGTAPPISPAVKDQAVQVKRTREDDEDDEAANEAELRHQMNINNKKLRVMKYNINVAERLKSICTEIQSHAFDTGSYSNDQWELLHAKLDHIQFARMNTPGI